MTEKLIITVAPTDGFTYSSRDFPAIPETLQQIVDATADAYEVGASIAHLHGPWSAPQGGQPTLDIPAWREMARMLRARCPGMIIQFGVAGGPLQQREQLLQGQGDEHPDMMSVCLTEHDYNFAGKELYIMHTRPELMEYCKLCSANRVKPEFEVFHIGAYYNLRFITEHGAVPPPKPHWLTFFVGSTGGVWTPPTIDELHYRLRYLPPDSLWQICPRAGVKGTMNSERYLQLLVEGMLLGGHVRVGVEDNPYYDDATKAVSSAQLVERVVKIAGLLGREVATPGEARQILGMEARA